MPLVAAQAHEPVSRRERFRGYMARMAAAADPVLAIEQQMYVPPPRPLAEALVRHLEIEPAGRHLVVGGIGSGKSTQLLLATQALSSMSDMCAAYIDVGYSQDLVRLKPGCLVALAGLALLEHLPKKTEGRSEFVAWANGFDADPREMEGDQDWSVRIEGVVTPPQPAWREIDDIRVRELSFFAEKLRESGRSFVALFDSLDRTSNREGFAQLVEQDIAALHRCRIGVVLIGPIRSLEGFGRLEVDRFDKLHLQAPVDVEQDPAAQAFLSRVLRARAAESLLPDAAALAIVAASGGVLRDLISIAKSAGDEAYLAGADQIELPHVAAATDAFGRSMMVGLQPAEIATLKHVRSGGGFVWTSDDDVTLVATRRVLHYPGPPARYRVHPSIAPLLDQKAS
jgi:energy-coupling factor transporter ATP-binding protein EcfA2